jgi:hypothetical protein
MKGFVGVPVGDATLARFRAGVKVAGSACTRKPGSTSSLSTRPGVTSES